MKTKEYKYTDDKDYTIVNVVMDGDKIVSCKLTEVCLTNRVEYIELMEFLEEIKSMPWKYDKCRECREECPQNLKAWELDN